MVIVSSLPLPGHSFLGLSRQSGSSNSGGLTLEELDRLVNVSNPNWEYVACMLINDSQNWRIKEDILLRALTYDPYAWVGPKTLATLAPDRNSMPSTDGKTLLVECFTAFGNVLRRNSAPNGDDNNILREICQQKIEEAREYFVRARQQINGKLAQANKARKPGLPLYKEIPDYIQVQDEPTTIEYFSTCPLPVQYLNPRVAFYPASRAGTHPIQPSSPLEAVQPANRRLAGFQAERPTYKLIDKALVSSSKRILPSMPQLAFFRARIVAHGVTVATLKKNQLEQYLIIAIAINSPLASNSVPPLEGDLGAPRTHNIQIGSEWKPIPVCLLVNNVLIAPTGKKYKFPDDPPIAEGIAKLVTNNGYKVHTPEGGAEMHLVIFQDKYKWIEQADKLDPEAKRIINELKTAVASGELMFLSASPTLETWVCGLNVVTTHLWDRYKKNLGWLLAQDKQEEIVKSLKVKRQYQSAVKWARSEGGVKKKLIAIESGKNSFQGASTDPTTSTAPTQPSRKYLKKEDS